MKIEIKLPNGRTFESVVGKSLEHDINLNMLISGIEISGSETFTEEQYINLANVRNNALMYSEWKPYNDLLVGLGITRSMSKPTMTIQIKLPNGRIFEIADQYDNRAIHDEHHCMLLSGIGISDIDTLTEEQYVNIGRNASRLRITEYRGSEIIALFEKLLNNMDAKAGVRSFEQIFEKVRIERELDNRITEQCNNNQS